ncbi:MAG: DUF1573 domain-containing protein [Bacteroidota bacterium]
MFIRVFITSIIIVCSLGVQAQTHTDHDGHDHGTTPVAKPVGEDPLVITEMKFDFGKIPQGKPVYHLFTVKNVGSTPVKFDNVQAACGCTTPEWSREEIGPGGTSIIRVGYNAATEGVFEKPVTIYYGNRVKQFTIAGNVWRAPEGPAPRNASIELLKKQSR